MLFQSSKLKAWKSFFIETWQKRRSSFELWAFENVTPRGIGCTCNVIFSGKPAASQRGGQRSRMSAEAHAECWHYFLGVRIHHMFLISKCRGGLDLGLWTTLVLANRMQPHISKFRQILLSKTFCNRRSPPRSGIVYTSTEVVHKPGSESPLHFDQIHMEKWNASARRLLGGLIESWRHICRVKILFGWLSTNRFVSTRTNLMTCLVNWNLLRIRVPSRNTQLYLNEWPMSRGICVLPIFPPLTWTISLLGLQEIGTEGQRRWGWSIMRRKVIFGQGLQKHRTILCYPASGWAAVSSKWRQERKNKHMDTRWRFSFFFPFMGG